AGCRHRLNDAPARPRIAHNASHDGLLRTPTSVGYRLLRPVAVITLIRWSESKTSQTGVLANPGARRPSDGDGCRPRRRPGSRSGQVVLLHQGGPSGSPAPTGLPQAYNSRRVSNSNTSAATSSRAA